MTGPVAEHAFGEERRERIVAVVNARGRVRIGELAREVAASEPTVRKDLALLERAGLLRRTHGGALALRPPAERSFVDRLGRDAEAKTAIARVCVDLVADGDAIYLDSGTTTLRIAELLTARNVNALTNGIAVAAALAEKPTVRHTLLGGVLRPSAGAVAGALAVENLARFTVSTAFIGVTGLTARRASRWPTTTRLSSRRPCWAGPGGSSCRWTSRRSASATSRSSHRSTRSTWWSRPTPRPGWPSCAHGTASSWSTPRRGDPGPDTRQEAAASGDGVGVDRHGTWSSSACSASAHPSSSKGSVTRCAAALTSADACPIATAVPATREHRHVVPAVADDEQLARGDARPAGRPLDAVAPC